MKTFFNFPLASAARWCEKRGVRSRCNALLDSAISFNRNPLRPERGVTLSGLFICPREPLRWVGEVAGFFEHSYQQASRVRFPAPEANGLGRNDGLQAVSCNSEKSGQLKVTLTELKKRDRQPSPCITCGCSPQECSLLNLRNEVKEMQYLVPLYSQNKSEAEIQADLYGDLKLIGLDARMEVKGHLQNDPKRKRCRFDIVVFWPLNHRPICIVECKKGRGVSKRSTQIHRYEKFGLPVLVCGRNGHSETIEKIYLLAVEDNSSAPPSFDWNKFTAAYTALSTP